jgi:hypothetical protein
MGEGGEREGAAQGGPEPATRVSQSVRSDRRRGERGCATGAGGGGRCRHGGRVEEGEGGPAQTGKQRTQRNPRYNNEGFSQGKKTLTGVEKETID